jgi:ribosomal protein S18 acetylase RimI-like enzyme
VEFRSVASNLRDSFRVLAARASRGEVRELPGVSIASSGVAFQMFNAAFLSAPVGSDVELDHCVQLAEVHFDARGQEWAYWICNGWLDHRVRRRAQQIFSRHNLRLSVELPGMICENLLAPLRPPPRLDIRRVANEPTRDAFCELGSACFNVPLPWFREVFQASGVWGEFVAYVGYADGEPVCTAATVTGSGVVGVYNVGTLPSHRRHGYGEAMVRHALAVARSEHGLTRSILQSTQSGIRLYEQLGFRAVTSVSVYAS